MAKKNISASVDEEVYAFLSQDRINTSGLINDLAKSYMNGKDGKQQMLELRKDQLKSELSQVEGREEAIRQQLESVEAQLEDVNSIDEDKLQEVFGILDGLNAKITVDNPGVQTQADNLGIEPEELIERYQHHNN